MSKARESRKGGGIRDHSAGVISTGADPGGWIGWLAIPLFGVI